MFKALAEFQSRLPAQVTQLTRLPRHVKLTALGLTVGLALMSFLAAFFRRRRRRALQIKKKLQTKREHRQLQLNQRLQGRLAGAVQSASASTSHTAIPNGGMTLTLTLRCCRS
jgi:C4-dicarboxylate-specific signal transduction histidine kinase